MISSSNPSPSGASVTFTDSLPAGLSGTTITFANGSTNLGTYQVTGTTAIITTSALPGGTDSITATYSGDANNNASLTASLTCKQSIKQRRFRDSDNNIWSKHTAWRYSSPRVFLQVLPAPHFCQWRSSDWHRNSQLIRISQHRDHSASGGNRYDHGKLYGDDNNYPNQGTVNQIVSKSDSKCDGYDFRPGQLWRPRYDYGYSFRSRRHRDNHECANPIGTGTISPTGSVTITTTTLPVGDDPITVKYGGDGDINSATGNTTQTVSKANASVTLSSSVNPSLVGQSVTLPQLYRYSLRNGDLRWCDCAGHGNSEQGSASITTLHC